MSTASFNLTAAKRPIQGGLRPFVPAQRSTKRNTSDLRCQAGESQQNVDSGRRQVLQLSGASLVLALFSNMEATPAQAAKGGINIVCDPTRYEAKKIDDITGMPTGIGGFTPIKDPQDGYTFLSPFGWQEVSVKGQDVVYKDVIEPLESVSVSLTPTDKENITQFGSPTEIAATLSKNVLTPANQDVKVLNVAEREADGRKYVEFEFASKAPNYIRHALASVTIANGKFYTLTTGANENRWDKMKDRLKYVISSFDVKDRYPTS